MRAHTILKQTAATAASTATEDQATDHTKQSKLERTDFTLGTLKRGLENRWELGVGTLADYLVPHADVQESAPTTDQLSSILEYLGPAQAGNVITDATSTTDALKKFKADQGSFKAPVTVDWMNARAGTSIIPTRKAPKC